MDTLSVLLYGAAVVLLAVAALPALAGRRVSLALLAAAVLVFTFFVLPELG